MFLERLKAWFQKISLRLFFLYAAVFITSALLLFSGSYFLLLNSLKEQDVSAIKAELQIYAKLFEQGGVEMIESKYAIVKKFESPERYFLRIADSDNKTILIKLPYQWASFNLKELELSKPQNETWHYIKAEDRSSHLEVYTVRLTTGHWIQIGKSTEGREKILQRFKEVSSLIVIFMLLIGSVTGALLSHRALKPVRELISLIKSLNIKNLNERVPEPASKDELWELVILFNQLLDRISNVVNAMKKSLDSVAHDLRTPITRMRGTAEMALCADCNIETLREALSDCVEESDKVLRLLNAIMDIAEAEAGALKLKKEALSLKALIDPLVELYRPVAEEKGVALQVHVEEDIHLLANPIRLSQAIANLLDNAIKYTQEDTTVRISAGKTEAGVQITVEDQGPGIEAEEEDKIWNWFYRSDSARGKRGLGIGLATVKAIVEAHGGKVKAESRNGSGSRFVVELPAA